MDDDTLRTLAAALLALDIPDACLPGVAQNLAALAEHARRVEAAE